MGPNKVILQHWGNSSWSSLIRQKGRLLIDISFYLPSLVRLVHMMMWIMWKNSDKQRSMCLCSALKLKVLHLICGTRDTVKCRWETTHNRFRWSPSCTEIWSMKTHLPSSFKQVIAYETPGIAGRLLIMWPHRSVQKVRLPPDKTLD